MLQATQLQHYAFTIHVKCLSIISLFTPFFMYRAQQPAGCASAHGCSDWSPANGGASGVTCDACDVGGGPKPLLNASACNDSIKRLAAWRSASRSSAVCRLEMTRKTNGNRMKNKLIKYAADWASEMNKLLYYLLQKSQRCWDLRESAKMGKCVGIVIHRWSEVYFGTQSINLSLFVQWFDERSQLYARYEANLVVCRRVLVHFVVHMLRCRRLGAVSTHL